MVVKYDDFSSSFKVMLTRFASLNVKYLILDSSCICHGLLVLYVLVSVVLTLVFLGSGTTILFYWAQEQE